ncbi:hypothetical protein HHK36_002681 [Tetracentron sinense]|uniref:DWD hypersensitive to UV-B 1 N-terminal domain-containing protein n=1 Tax=Tetracentron sinense TaxID=13715 RepID=A0A834ZLY0_TETSI|nr:hypothetical protein HHK36_002681 [Tetracentron sinense]
MDISSLEARYLDSCKRQEALPNPAILSGFLKAKLQKSRHELCSLEVFLDHLKEADFPPLLDVFAAIDLSEIDAVDILHESSCVLSGENVLSLMRAVKQKLRVADLQDLLFGKEFLSSIVLSGTQLPNQFHCKVGGNRAFGIRRFKSELHDIARDLSRGGLTCQVLNLRSSHIQKLNMIGKFMQLCTLNLDFSTSLTSFGEDCFTCMPNLTQLSMCETRVTNLWTTSAALSKLPSLLELRFQNCLCCNDTGPCPASSSEKANFLVCDKSGSRQVDGYPYTGSPTINSGNPTFQNSGTEETFGNLFPFNDLIMTRELQSTTEDSSDDSEVDFSSHQWRKSLELLSNVYPVLNGQPDLRNEVSLGTLWTRDEEVSFASAFNSRHTSASALKKYISHHPSPICFEKHYREYLVASLPHLEVLDNLPIKEIEREMAKIIFTQYNEYLPYKRQQKESVVSILQNREMGASSIHLQKSPKLKRPYPPGKSQYFFSRSLCAAKVGSSAWPLIYPVSKFSSMSREESKKFRPRQFEYHPSNSYLMVFGTLEGELVVINHENGKLVGYIPSRGAMNSVLGLCWLKKYPFKLIAGSDNGSLKLYDVHHMPSTVTGIYCSSGTVTFDDFEQLTSVHVNSTDEQFLASGYSKNVALYDINSGRRLQVFTDMHREHINVVKFANHSPYIFATSSFDQDVKMWDLRQKPVRPCYTASSSRGNVMVCFSPDDHYLLVSAVDNEVKQLLAVDGRLNMKFEIASTGSAQNYTRSYYMNGRDYIISGSCDEHVVRICCAQTGRRLRDISLEGRGSGNSMFVQSLRGDPFRDFHMSVLAAYMHPSSKSEIIKVNLLASNDHAKEYSFSQCSRPYYGMGG